ncbi:MAG: ORF6N domain-containing protein [Kiritimatiellae bacterium]|nr:ORF6N domain-containing protein [Kiritimatiellia bacterium]MBR0198297.1 ORF6N domain-containing protein [Kiritimatiellia bacterium]
MKTELLNQNENVLSIDHVKSRMVVVRGQLTLLDRDVAELYGVKTREVNQAVRNNPAKFPNGYVFQLDDAEVADWRSKILISDLPQEEKDSIRKGLRYAPYAFTERGLYMLATILKGERATRTTLAIIDTYAQVRELARTMEALQTVKDGGGEQQTLLHRTGEILANVISDNLKTESSETEIELNFAVVKIRHKIIRHKR